MALVFYYKDMLEKVKCNACAFDRKIETDYFSRNMPIFNDPVVKNFKKFGRKIDQRPRE